jgi:hypothetical protein
LAEWLPADAAEVQSQFRIHHAMEYVWSLLDVAGEAYCG